MSEGAMSTDVCKPDCSYLKRVQFGEGAMSTNIEKTTVIGQMVHCNHIHDPVAKEQCVCVWCGVCVCVCACACMATYILNTGHSHW